MEAEKAIRGGLSPVAEPPAAETGSAGIHPKPLDNRPRPARRRLLRTLDRLGLLTAAFRAYESARALRPYTRPPGLDGIPLPPGRLRVRVSGDSDPAWFLESGRLTAATLEDALGRHGRELRRMERVLDFGCGCGRIIRHWGERGSVALHGCDRDHKGVRWCREWLDFARFAGNGPAPPLPYPDDWFDAVCAVSVFTHLPEDDQLVWVRELRRVLHPGGTLVLTTHGDRYAGRLMADERAEYEAGRLVVRRPSAAGTTLCTAFHPESYVRGFLADGFELLEFSPQGAVGTPYQDLVVLRKPSIPSADQRPPR